MSRPRQYSARMVIPMGPMSRVTTCTISSSSHDWSGKAISRSQAFESRGEPNEVLHAMQSKYSLWHPFLGCEILVDYGKGPLHYVLSESFGEFVLESSL